MRSRDLASIGARSGWVQEADLFDYAIQLATEYVDVEDREEVYKDIIRLYGNMDHWDLLLNDNRRFIKDLARKVLDE